MRALLTNVLKEDRRAVAILELWLAEECAPFPREQVKALISDLSTDGVLLNVGTQSLAAIELLARRGSLQLLADDGSFAVYPLRSDFALGSARPEQERWKTSKFTYLAFEFGTPEIRNPLSDRYFSVHDPALLRVLGDFAEPKALDTPLAVALADANMLLPCDPEGTTIDECDPARMSWELHDLILHSRSRLGRTEGAVGANWRFETQFANRATAGEAVPQLKGIDLPEPFQQVYDPPLFATAAIRRSVRSFSAELLNLPQLGLFLHHAVRARCHDRESEPRRPYPNGGALYEQNFYLALDRCEGAERGLYRYDDRAHRLYPIADGDAVSPILETAARAMSVSARPPALLVITSRFGVVAWKYSGLAYALQLKHAGVISEWLYLSATATGLGGCAIGTGDSDAFGRIAALNYLEEGSIAEFAFGIPA